MKDCSTCENYKDCLFKDEADPTTCEGYLNTDAGFENVRNAMTDKWVIEVSKIGSLLPAEWKHISGFYFWQYKEAYELFQNFRENLQPIQTAKGWLMPYKNISETEFEYYSHIYKLKKI